MKKNYVPTEVTNRLSVKNIKSGFGHDLQGLFAHVYLDNKRVGYYNDDGWGGEVDLSLNSEARDVIEALLAQCNFAQLMFDNGWNFKQVSTITPRLQVEIAIYEIIFASIMKKDIDKFNKKLAKDMVKGICVGNDTSYYVITYKGGDIPTLLQNPEKLKASIVKYIMPTIPQGQKILNTNLIGIEL